MTTDSTKAMTQTMKAVEAIIDNLCGRSGFDSAFDLDDKIMEEIKKEMADAIDAHLAPREVSDEDVCRFQHTVEEILSTSKLLNDIAMAELYRTDIGKTPKIDVAICSVGSEMLRAYAALQADRQRGGWSEVHILSSIFDVDEVDEVALSVYGKNKRAYNMLRLLAQSIRKALLAQRGQVREGWLIVEEGDTCLVEHARWGHYVFHVATAPDTDTEGKGNV